MDSKQFFEVRAFPNKKDRYKEFTDRNFIAIGWPNIGDVSGKNKEEIKDLLSLHYKELQNDSNSENLKLKIKRSQTATFFVRFLQMKNDDIILIPYEDSVTFAIVTEKYHYDDCQKEKDKHIAHKVGIRVMNTVKRSELSDSLHNSLKARLTVTKFTEDKYQEILKFVEVQKSDENSNSNSNAKAYIENIKALENEFDKANQDLVKKSILLSVFSLFEGYLKEMIKTDLGINDSRSDLEPHSKAHSILLGYGEKSVREELKKHHSRKIIYKKLYDKKEESSEYPSSDQQKIRNELAHDISVPQISGDTIIISTDKNKDIVEYIPDLFTKFKDFPNKLNGV